MHLDAAQWVTVSHLTHAEVADVESEYEPLDVEAWPTRLSPFFEAVGGEVAAQSGKDG